MQPATFMKNLLNAVLARFHASPLDMLIMVLLAIAILTLIKLQLDTQVGDDWEKFVAEHHCTANKFKDDKQLKSGWICDDGKEYYRWRQQL
jgi:hypothetical protein